MDSVVLSCLAFLLIHLFVAGSSIRRLLIDAIGQGAYFGLFSIASLGALIWMSTAYTDALEVSYEVLWSVSVIGQWGALALMLPATILVVTGLLTKNPTATMQEKMLLQGDKTTGILRVTRHPFLSGVAIWAAVHVFGNGDLPSLIFFGTFFVVVVAGARSIDHKRYVAYGSDWQKFASETSIMPFGAILQGRNSFKAGELGWKGLLGVALYAALVYFHASIFGISVVPT